MMGVGSKLTRCISTPCLPAWLVLGSDEGTTTRLAGGMLDSTVSPEGACSASSGLASSHLRVRAGARAMNAPANGWK